MTFPSKGSPEFWDYYRKLSPAVQRLARKNYGLWKEEPFHPSLHFKKVHGENWSARIGRDFRAIGKFVEGGFLWEWIGPHDEYNRLS